ncbi:XRE family transcriptional regulator [Lacibacter luteus]|uniref:XRE family transcriptional regulator n=1 Tax=Lacibacter luteus TaxID=2508719 RepID=A0A4Q1CIB1_9BACT|nr:helix-turn-helix transcriptional regulator [Lacibacter luteus]RXK60326.1 XRE family transcriptional regulator [Lacibacter luteus]
MDTSTTKTIHEGRNVKRFREMLGIKQEALAAALGEDWNQKKISLLEAKDKLESNILAEVAKALKVPVEAIRNFDEEAAINIIGNTVTTVNDNATGQLFQIQPTFNPIDKWVEAMEENKQLYERLLQTEREKVALLEQLLRK